MISYTHARTHKSTPIHAYGQRQTKFLTRRYTRRIEQIILRLKRKENDFLGKKKKNFFLAHHTIGLWEREQAGSSGRSKKNVDKLSITIRTMYSEEKKKKNLWKKMSWNSIYFSDEASHDDIEIDRRRERERVTHSQCFPYVYIMNAIAFTKIYPERKIKYHAKTTITLKYFNEAIIFSMDGYYWIVRQKQQSHQLGGKIKKKKCRERESKWTLIDVFETAMGWSGVKVSEWVREWAVVWVNFCSSNKHYIVIDDDDHRIVVILSVTEWVFRALDI